MLCVMLRHPSVVLDGAVECSPPEHPQLLLGSVRQVVAGQSVAQCLAVLAVDESHVLSEMFQSTAVLLAFVISSMLVFELLECIMHMPVVIVDELPHGVHGVGVVQPRPGPAVTILLEEQIEDVGMVQHLGSEVLVSDVVVVVVGAQQGVVSLHLVVDRLRHPVLHLEPDCVPVSAAN